MISILSISASASIDGLISSSALLAENEPVYEPIAQSGLDPTACFYRKKASRRTSTRAYSGRLTSLRISSVTSVAPAGEAQLHRSLASQNKKGGFEDPTLEHRTPKPNT